MSTVLARVSAVALTAFIILILSWVLVTPETVGGVVDDQPVTCEPMFIGGWHCQLNYNHNQEVIN